MSSKVIIVGAGPSGLLLSLQLARAGISCTLLDSGSSVDERPRAAHYGPAAIKELRRAGVLEDIRDQGFIPGNIYWRKLDHSIIAEMRDSSQPNIPDAMTVLPLGDLGKILVKHTENYPNLEVLWSHSVDSISQDESSATASGTRSDGTKFSYSAEYLVGTDGGQSTVRKSLFGRNFEGFSWERQLIATNVYLSEKDIPTLGETNFIMVSSLIAVHIVLIVEASRTPRYGCQNHERWSMASILWRERRFDIRRSPEKTT